MGMAADEGPGVGVRPGGHRAPAAGQVLHHLPQVHHQDAVGDRCLHHGQVMGDQQIGQGPLLPQVQQQIDDLAPGWTRPGRRWARRTAAAGAPPPGLGRCRCAGACRRRTRGDSGTRPEGLSPTCSISGLHPVSGAPPGRGAQAVDVDPLGDEVNATLFLGSSEA